MGRRTGIATVLVAAIAIAAPSAAAGQDADDGAQVDEYVESIPSAGGDEPTEGGDFGPSGGGGDGADTAGGDEGATAEPPAISSETAQALEAQGADGRATAELAQAGAPAGGSGPQHAAGGDGAESKDAGTGGSGIAAVADSVTGSEGLGPALPLVLVLIAAAGIGYAVWRRRIGPQA